MLPVSILILIIGFCGAQISQQDVLDMIAAEISSSCKVPTISGCTSGVSCKGTNCGHYSDSFEIHKNSDDDVYRLFVYQTDKFEDGELCYMRIYYTGLKSLPTQIGLLTALNSFLILR